MGEPGIRQCGAKTVEARTRAATLMSEALFWRGMVIRRGEILLIQDFVRQLGKL